MIQILREGSHKYPWLLKSIMGLLAITFIITMGWWGFGEQKVEAVASVGELTVTRDEFRRAYENTHRFFKDKGVNDVKDEELKKMVVEGLVEGKLWSLVAKDLGLTVSAAELRDNILQVPAFQKDGKFDPEQYRRLLAANRLTPALFETLQGTELLREKAMTVIRDSVALTPAEITEAQSLMSRQLPTETTPGARAASEQLMQDFLAQKQQRALAAYREAFRSRVPVDIHKELL